MFSLKIEIEPSFIASSYLLLEQDADRWRCTFAKKEFSYQNEPARTWTVVMDNEPDAERLCELADRVITEARVDNYFHLDGVGLTCYIAEEGVTRSHNFASPEEGTTELLLMEAVLELSQRYITDEVTFTNYIELLEGYFVSGLPVKIYDETPLKVRFYGSLTTLQQDQLVALIAQLEQEESLVIDMTNFQGMGTFLYPCFQPLHRIKHLEFMANEEGRRHLQAMGFKP